MKKKLKRKRGSPSSADFGKGLEALLGEQVSVEEFKTTYFEKKPLHVVRSDSTSSYYGPFNDLSSPEGLFSLMDAGTVPVYRVNMFRCRDGSNKETPNPPPQTPSDVRRLFKEGWSIQWLQPQQEHDKLASFVAVLESQFGSLVGVNAYLTPPGAQGLAPHWDDVEVFVLQLGGCKSWKLHQSISASPLPPEAQSLPRYSSGDLDMSSLCPMMMHPKLAPGDFLYFPRGIIHHAPNQDSKLPSVHLTISCFQRQTLFDLVQKSFEEAMSELWEDDEALRKALPWQAFSSTGCHARITSAVAKQLRRLADAVEDEAKVGDGPVAGALAELNAEFVQHRMPPVSSASADSMSLVSASSRVSVADVTALALVPLPGEEDGSVKLLHYVGNSRRNHMMKHPETLPCEEPFEEAEEENPCEEDEEEDDLEGEEEEEMDDEAQGQIISSHAAAAIRRLCAASRQSVQPLEVHLAKADIPKASWAEVCTLMTQLAALGLVLVHESDVAAPAEIRGNLCVFKVK